MWGGHRQRGRDDTQMARIPLRPLREADTDEPMDGEEVVPGRSTDTASLPFDHTPSAKSNVRPAMKRMMSEPGVQSAARVSWVRAVR